MRLIAELLHLGQRRLAVFLRLCILESRLDLLELLDQLVVLSLHIVRAHGSVGHFMREVLRTAIGSAHEPKR